MPRPRGLTPALLLLSAWAHGFRPLGVSLKTTGYAFPDFGDLNEARGFLSEAEVRAAGHHDPYHVQVRLLYRAYGQTPFDPDSTAGDVLGPAGGRYQNEIGGLIAAVERDLRTTLRAGVFGRLMHAVTYSGGAEPQADPHAAVFRMDAALYGSGGLVAQAGDENGSVRGYFEWGGIAGARKPFLRSRSHGSVRLLHAPAGSFTVRAFIENVHGEPPYLESVKVGGGSTLRGYATNRFLGDQGAGFALEWDSPLAAWKAGRLRAVVFADLARAWSRGLWADIGPPPGEDWGRSFGLGLRHIARSDRANFPWIEVDLAFGKDPWREAPSCVLHLRLSPWGEDPLGR